MTYRIIRSRSGFYHLSRDGYHLSVSFTLLGAHFSLWWWKHAAPYLDQFMLRRARVIYEEKVK